MGPFKSGPAFQVRVGEDSGSQQGIKGGAGVGAVSKAGSQSQVLAVV